MATIKATIEKVTAGSTRVDLTEKLQASFKSCLYSAHKIDKFARDLATVNITDPAILANKVALSLPMNLPRLREIRGVQQYLNYTIETDLSITPIQEIPVCAPGFQDLNGLIGTKNYFGFKYSQLYSIVGNMVNFSGIDSATKVLQVHGLFLPTYEEDPIDGDWITDSWIMEECPELVEAYLRYRLAEIIEDTKKLQIADMNIQRVRRDTLAAYSHELLGENHGC